MAVQGWSSRIAAFDLHHLLVGRPGYLRVGIQEDPRGGEYLLVFVTFMDEDLFDLMPQRWYGLTVIVEQVGTGKRLA